jgi:hypothetical protein
MLKCVLMYLPGTLAWDLLRHIASGPTSSSSMSTKSSSSFVVVAIYDPIPGHDRLGQLMIENLKRAGIAGGNGDGRQQGDDDRECKCSNTRRLPSLEVMHTLTDQLVRLVCMCGFNVAVGCTMVGAYKHGVIRDGDREHAMRCKALDELEEFYLLMRHYCLLVGVGSSSSHGVIRINVEEEDDDDGRASSASACDDDGGSNVSNQLCFMGAESPMEFQD